MVKRIKVALIARNFSGWTGGVYYLLNLVQALNLLPDSSKPKLVIIYWDDESKANIKALNYPYIRFVHFRFNLPKFKRGINKLSLLLLQKKIIDDTYFNKQLAQYIFPNPIEDKFKYIPHKLYWIPDFQEKYLPHFFSSEEVTKREKQLEYLSCGNKNIVFSSKDALSDLNKFFPNSNAKTFVLPFAVTHPVVNILNTEEVLNKYQLNKIFFLAPNQFWQHKNHETVIKAVELLLKKGIEVQVVFTGKENDYRDPTYPSYIRNLILEKGLQKNILMLGFISREHLVLLIQKAIAIIQPSLFEGWSTVVEDAKAQNKIVIASNIAVHKEQLKDAGIYFSPKNEEELAEKISEVLIRKFDFSGYHYENDVLNFGLNFMKVLYAAL